MSIAVSKEQKAVAREKLKTAKADVTFLKKEHRNAERDEKAAARERAKDLKFVEKAVVVAQKELDSLS